MGKQKSTEIKRTSIDEKTKLYLWGVSAGRCEICNKLLYIDTKYGDKANLAENAHIHAVGANGPRHKEDMTQEEINNSENLMLLCAEHHHLIDTKADNYSAEELIECKKRHEERVRKLTEIQDDASCKMVTFFSNIDNIEISNDDMLFKRAIVRENLYPKQDTCISLNEGAPTRYVPSKESLLYKAQELEYQVKQWFGSIVKKSETIAIFALAPQPLLFKVGTLFCDQLNVHVFQCHRDGEKWVWSQNNATEEYIIKRTC